MRSARLALLAAVVTVSGCFFQPGSNSGGSVSDLFVSDVSTSFDLPTIVSARVRVLLVNPSSRDIDANVRMRVAGIQVHDAVRRVRAGGSELVIGPDRADSVLISGIVLGTDPISLLLRTFFLGVDFRAGDTITVTLYEDPVVPPPTQPPPVEPPPVEPPALAIRVVGLDSDLSVNPNMLVSFGVAIENASSAATFRVLADPDATPASGNELVIAQNLPGAAQTSIDWVTAVPLGDYRIYAELTDGSAFLRSATAPGLVHVIAPPALAIRILGLDSDLRVNPNTLVSFSVAIENASSAATFRVLADPDALPASGNELVIAQNLPGAAQTSIDWVTAVPPAAYRIYAEVTDGSTFLRSATAAGLVRVNAQPTMVFDSPRNDLLVSRGRSFIIGWAATDDDDDAQITIFLDRDTDFGNGVQELRTGISENDTADNSLEVSALELQPINYYVGGRITDGLSTVIVYGPRICVTHRLAGRISASDAAPAHVTVFRGQPTTQPATQPTVRGNWSLGAAIDVSQDVEGDGFSDVLVADPYRVEADSAPATVGAVYYQRSPDFAPWAETINVDPNGVTFTMLGVQDNALPGASIALLPYYDPNTGENFANFLVGAPQYEFVEETDQGVLHEVASFILDEYRQMRLGGFGDPPFEGMLAGTIGENLGRRVAALFDLSDDDVSDIAVSGPIYDSFRGRVALIDHDPHLFVDSINGVGGKLRGSVLTGDNYGDEFGFALTGAPRRCFGEFCTTPFVAIGAPGYQGEVGQTYVLLYSEDFFSAGFDVPIGEALGSAYSGFVITGENPGDRAGAALGWGDFNRDGLIDLLIGAPGYDSNRGRVYVVTIDRDLADPVAFIDLSEFDGFVIDGIAIGDLLGWSVAGAGDFDFDGFDDLIVGAPGAESQAGAAYLVYGGISLPDAIPLDLIGTCSLAGVEFVGEEPGQRVGYALSGRGYLNADPFADIGLGAPGDASEGGATFGEAYLLFGVPGFDPNDPNGPDSP